MGGSAFSSLPDAPYTPRMPPDVYRRAMHACHATLRHLFVFVATPIEGPGKTDYGDIDVLVAVERRVAFPRSSDDAVPRTSRDLMATIQGLLGAERAIIHPTGESANLAIRWPRDMEGGVQAGDSSTPETKYIQVDVRICPDLDQFCWTLFKHAHGDIWNLLGSILRPFGLTVDEEALWLRIPEIEKLDRKKAKVRLSGDPVEILHFLGMRVEGFWAEPFGSVAALFEYATTCRFFWLWETPAEDAAEGDAHETGVAGEDQAQLRLKSNERRRLKGRPIYRQWINEFIPNLRVRGKSVRSGSIASIEEVRGIVRDEAFARFFIEPEYRQRLRDWRLKREETQMKTFVKELIPSTLEAQFRATLVSAMRKIVMEDDGSFGITPPRCRDKDGFYDTGATRNFVEENWEVVGATAWAKQQAKAQEAMQLKASGRKV